MSKQEKIVCAAIKRTGWDYRGEDLVVIDLCLEYGDEHSTVNYFSNLDIGAKFYDTEEVKGFITNTNRFVDPVEATEIAYNARQLSRTLREGTPLKPEDLY